MYNDERNISHFWMKNKLVTTANIYKNNESPACQLQSSVANTPIYYTHSE